MQQKGALIFLTVILAVLLPALLRVASPFFTSFVLASILAIMLYPVKEWIRTRTRIRRPAAAALLTTLMTVSVLGVLLAGVGITLTGELTNAYQALSQQSLQEGGWPALATRTTERLVDILATLLPIDKEAIRLELIDRMKSVSEYLLSNAGVAVGGVSSLVVTTLLVTIFLYFLLRYGSEWIDWLSELSPLDSRTDARIIRTIHDSVVANLSGMFAVAIGQGLLLSLGFWLAGVQSALLWGAIGGLASIVPIVGALLIWVPVALAYVISGAYWKALFLALWGLLIVGSADNVLRPWVVGKREKQHPMLIALAAIGGTYAFGALGILLGPLLISVAAALLDEIQRLIPHHRPAAKASRTPAE